MPHLTSPRAERRLQPPPQTSASPEDAAIAAERAAQRHVAPYWMFGPRTPAQERIQHPALHEPGRPA